MAKSLDDSQLDDVFDAEDDDFGKGIEDTPSKSSPKSEAPPDDDDDLDPEEGVTEDPEPEAETVSVRDIVSKYGLSIEGDDDVEGLEKLLGNVQQYVQSQRQRESQYQEQLRQYQYQLSQQVQQPPQQQAPTQKQLQGLLKHWEKVPEWSDDWRSMVKQDDNGEWVAKPGADPSLPQKIAARIAWEERAQRLFFENPQQFVYETFQANDGFQTAIQEKIQQAVYEVQDRIEAQRIADQMRPHITNEDGSLNDAGRVYWNTVQQAQQAGIYDTQRLHQIALQATLPLLQQKQAPKESPTETKRKKQLTFAKNQVAKTQNKSRKKSPAVRLGDADDMTRYAIQQMKDAGIDPNALAEVR